MKRPLVLFLAALALATPSCGGAPTGDSSSASRSSSRPSEAATDKYNQTWTTPYDKTTCTQFKHEMTAKQRWAMAADMLVGARKVDGQTTKLPPDAMIDEFEGGLANVCVIDTMTMADAGAGLYMTEPRFHP